MNFDFLTQPLIQRAYILNSYRGIGNPVVAFSSMYAKVLHATLKSLVLKTWTGYISLLVSRWSFELKCRVVTLYDLVKCLVNSCSKRCSFFVLTHGTVFWLTSGHLRPVCKFKELDAFLFKRPMCAMEMGSWTMSGKHRLHAMELNFQTNVIYLQYAHDPQTLFKIQKKYLRMICNQVGWGARWSISDKPGDLNRVHADWRRFRQILWTHVYM